MDTELNYNDPASLRHNTALNCIHFDSGYDAYLSVLSYTLFFGWPIRQEGRLTNWPRRSSSLVETSFFDVSRTMMSGSVFPAIFGSNEDSPCLWYFMLSSCPQMLGKGFVGFMA